MKQARYINLLREAQAIRTRFRKDMGDFVVTLNEQYMHDFAQEHTPEEVEAERARAGQILTTEYPPAI